MQCSVFCTAAMLRQAARLRSCSISAALGCGGGVHASVTMDIKRSQGSQLADCSHVANEKLE
jgi:hypothetical protein